MLERNQTQGVPTPSYSLSTVTVYCPTTTALLLQENRRRDHCRLLAGDMTCGNLKCGFNCKGTRECSYYPNTALEHVDVERRFQQALQPEQGSIDPRFIQSSGNGLHPTPCKELTSLSIFSIALASRRESNSTRHPRVMFSTDGPPELPTFRNGLPFREISTEIDKTQSHWSRNCVFKQKFQLAGLYPLPIHREAEKDISHHDDS